MALPNYQSIMLPILQLLSDRQRRTTHEVYEHVYKTFSLTEEEKLTRQPSGQDILITNRTRWALKDLKEAKALESPQRGVYAITDRGLKLVKQNPSGISMETLYQFDEFKNFKTHIAGETSRADEKPPSEMVTSFTPDELIEKGYKTIRDAVGKELIERIMQNSPAFFEKLVLDLLRAMEYGEGAVIGRPGDGGIDGFINQDKLGLDRVFFQAKRWTNTVPAKELRDFVGSLDIRGVSKGVFITTGKLPSDSQKIIGKSSKNIVFIDGDRLVNLLLDHGVGVSTQKRYEIREIDSDYFST